MKPHSQQPGIIKKGRYIHAKTGQSYEVIGIALDTEHNQLQVVYKPLYDSEYNMFVRPLAMFTETVTINGVSRPRFALVDG
ncbi:MAG: hypothetical protein QG649_630 [Patescibacteria group bacterium]|nr:hypothetical protein [Patescibacteria group bacterium]